jgi:hypothetical protein
MAYNTSTDIEGTSNELSETKKGTDYTIANIEKIFNAVLEKKKEADRLVAKQSLDKEMEDWDVNKLIDGLMGKPATNTPQSGFKRFHVGN